MARLVKTLLCALLLLSLVAGVQAQSETILVAPDVFLRGLQLPDQVRYTASFIKPTDDTVLRNVSVEITLPPDAVFTEMLVTRQVQFDVVRVNREGALTLIWQISRVAADTPLDSFSFTLAQPLTNPLEFYIAWQSEDGVQAVVNFLELPPLVIATQAEGQIIVPQESYLPVGETGVQVLAQFQSPPLFLTTRLLPADFNPPPEYQGIWWCSLLELIGLPQGTTADVIVPLRRPLAPFTTLQLFQQQTDNTWAALDNLALVTADGQYVMYTHPGGVVATGVEAELQPEIKPVSEIQIQPVDLPVVVEPPVEVVVNPPPAVEPITDGSSNTIIITENTAVPPQIVATQSPPTIAPITDGSSNTIIIGENTPIPALPTATRNKLDGVTIIGGTAVPTLLPTIAPITDGSSNTIIIGENTPVPTLPPTIAPITDGSSNTIIIGENTLVPVTASPTLLPTIAPITDGSSNTIIIGEGQISPTATRSKLDGVTIIGGTAVPTLPPTIAPITDGSSNTIIIGEGQISPTATRSKLDGVTIIGGTAVPTLPPTIAPITDGSSNTIIIGENTLVTVTAVPTLPPTIAPITDGSSNTIIISESQPTPLPPTATHSKLDNVIIVGGTITPTLLPTIVSITDGSSNTIIIGENSATPTTVNLPAATVRPPPSLPVTIVLNPISPQVPVLPFGAGGTRVVIFTQAGNGVLQCQIGSINCAVLRRTLGKGLR